MVAPSSSPPRQQNSPPARKAGGTSLAVLGILILLACGCGQAPTVPPEQPSQSLAVVVSCDTAGWIVPCGCSSKQSGGLLRRATYVQKLVDGGKEVLLVDVGGAPGGTSLYDQAKFEAVLHGEVAMRIAAHNLGAAEAELGVESLRDLASRTQAPLISTNVLDEQGHNFVESHRIVSVGSTRFAILGVLSPNDSHRGMRIEEPAPAVLKTIGSLQGQYDVLLILAYLPEEELEEFVKRVPEADLVMGGPTRQSIAPRISGPTTWAAATNKGKFLVSMERLAPDSKWNGEIVELGEEYADNSSQKANLDQFRKVLAERDFSANQTSFVATLSNVPGSQFQVAGTDACRSCHAADCQTWEGTAHGHAWQTLVEKGSHVDPYCQQCHTTGYGLPGGFQSLALGQARVNVGCESCHGPAQAHAENPKVKTIYNARDRCTHCHDHDNSPTFDFEKYWQKIDHGVPADPGEGT
jgi:hypothetical protein